MFSLIFFIISSILSIKTFYPIYTATEIIIPYGLQPFDICSTNPDLWHIIKLTYVFVFIFSNFVISHIIFSRVISKFLSLIKFSKNEKISNSDLSLNSIYLSAKKVTHSQKFLSSLSLLIGFDKLDKKNIIIPESGLYQNFLITGTIGSGKTSSAMLPFTRSIYEL